MIDFALLKAEVAAHPYPLLFATVSGAHLYGFPSPDSDYDLRGVHILPPEEALGLLPKKRKGRRTRRQKKQKPTRPATIRRPQLARVSRRKQSR